MMTQNPYAQPGDPGTGDFGISAEPPRTSVLAIFALVLSFICCLPVLPLVGVALGIVATLLITGSGGRVGGRGLAIGAIIVGLAVTGLQLAILWGIASGWNALRVSAGDAVTYAESRDYDAFRSEFDQRVRPLITDDVIDTYATGLQTTAGAYIEIPSSLSNVVSGYMTFDDASGPAIQSLNNSIAPTANTIPLPGLFDSGTVMLLPIYPTQTSGSTFPPPMANLGYLPQGESSPTWLIDLQTSIDAINGSAPSSSPSAAPTTDAPTGEGDEATANETNDEPAEDDSETQPEPAEPKQGEDG